jgi:N-acetylneuraminic acid mutarotase
MCRSGIYVCVARLSSLFAFALMLPALSKAQADNDWVWMSGSSQTLQGSVYGTKGVPSPANTPGARFAATSWTDKNGDFWLLGGEAGSSTPGAGYQLDELWKYDRVLRQWTFIQGDVSTSPVPGVYGTKGIPDAANHPGGREASAVWTDANGDVWIFGGRGYDSQGLLGLLNDLWKLNGATMQWMWVGGNSTLTIGAAGQTGNYGTKGVADPANLPGGRMQAATWIDQAGDLWLFGGNGFGSIGTAGQDYLNDLWTFSVVNSQWTWIAGSNQIDQAGNYGTLGASAPGNGPGSRQGPAGWLDKNGDMLLFGGIGLDSIGTQSYMNDLWRFSPANSQWTWIGGSNLGPGQGVFGTKGTASAANIPSGRLGTAIRADAAGNAFLYGGVGVDSAGHAGYLADLWEFDSTTGDWTWLGGSASAGTIGSYRVIGDPSLLNEPGSRTLANLWIEERGTVWLFGGFGLGATTQVSPLNDLWAFNPSINRPSINPDGGTFDGHATVSITDASPLVVQIFFTTDGSDPNPSSSLYSGPLTISTTETLKAIATAPGYLPSDVASASFTINQPVFAIAGTDVSIPAGATSGNVSQVTVTPASGFTGTVTLTAALTSSPAGAVKLPTLSFATNSVAVSSTASQTDALTITTVAPTMAAMHDPAGERLWPVGGTALGFLLLLRIRGRNRYLSFLGGLVLLVATTQAISGCGGGGGGNNGGGSNGGGTPGTTPGNYTITVTGTSGNLVKTSIITLTVK